MRGLPRSTVSPSQKDRHGAKKADRIPLSDHTYGYFNDFSNWNAWWHSGKWAFDANGGYTQRLPYHLYVKMRNKNRAIVARTFWKGVRRQVALHAGTPKATPRELGIDQWRADQAVAACPYRDYEGHCGNEFCRWCYEL